MADKTHDRSPLQEEWSTYQNDRKVIAERLAHYQQVLIRGRDAATHEHVHTEHYAAAMVAVIDRVASAEEELSERIAPLFKEYTESTNVPPVVLSSIRATLLVIGRTEKPESLEEEFAKRGPLAYSSTNGRVLEVSGIAASFCARAEQKWLAGNLMGAVDAMARATYWTAFLAGLQLSAAEDRPIAPTTAAQTLNDAKHSKNREHKKLALKFYDENRPAYASERKIAKHIASKVVPVDFSTAYSWILQHKKGLRTASNAPDL